MTLLHLGNLAQAHHAVTLSAHHQLLQGFNIIKATHRAQQVPALAGINLATGNVLVAADNGITQIEQAQATLGQGGFVHDNLHLPVGTAADGHLGNPRHALHPRPHAVLDKIAHQLDIQLTGIAFEGGDTEIHECVGGE